MKPNAFGNKTREELIAELNRLNAQQALVATNQPADGGKRRIIASHAKELHTEHAKRLEAERIGKIKDEFLANLSHEIRTPLSAILGWSYLLKPGKSSSEQMAEGLSAIGRNARVLSQLIGDLLDMSRIISGKLRLDVQRIELPSIINAAVEVVHLAAEAKGLRLEVIVDPIAGPITGDPNRMQQVVWNLLSNAIKFTPRGGKVQVTLERTDSQVELSVSDTGQGISPDFLPYIFDKFSQAESPVTKTHAGLGLGLAIVKNLVELHGGTVRAKSAGVGKGTTVTVSLPISVMRTHNDDGDGQHPTTAREAEINPDPDLSGVNVFVVDDDADTLALLKHILENCGAQVTNFSSGADCLDALQGSKPSVLIADIGMRGMDGYTLLQRVRALPAERGGQIPAIALTAFARSEDRRRAMLAGFDIHVAKPAEPGELVAVIARLARRS